MAEIYTMTDADIEVLSASAASPNLFFEHFCRPKGSDRYFQLDYNFDDDGKWQEEMCMAIQTFIVSICGIGTGKTFGVGMSATFHAVMTNHFKFMNLANESWQSQQMFEMIIEQTEDTILGKMIRAVRHPYYKIDIEYRLGEQIIRSSLQFMSLGEKKQATNIFTWRGDWVNIDEAWLIDDLGSVVSNLSTRLTGSTTDGRPYLGRMSLTSNPGESPDLWQFYDTAANDKENGLVFNIDTRANRNVTDAQIKQMVKHLTADQQIRFLTGRRVEGKGSWFNGAKVVACASEVASAALLDATNQGIEGYRCITDTFLGCWDFQMPRQDLHMYFLLGDPGIGAAPARNAPTIGVWDVTDAPNYVPLVAFWWGNGGQSIMPFTDKYLEFMDTYMPTLAGLDNTGPQRNTAELMNLHYVTGQKKSVQAITGMDFSGPKKVALLVAARMSVEEGQVSWPHIVTAIGSQLKNYDLAKDRNPNSKLAQDTVSMVSMACFAIRTWFPKPSAAGSEEQPKPRQNLLVGRHSRDVRNPGAAIAVSRRKITLPRSTR